MIYAVLLTVVLLLVFGAIRFRSSATAPAFVSTEKYQTSDDPVISEVVSSATVREVKPEQVAPKPAKVIPFQRFDASETVLFVARSGRVLAGKVVRFDASAYRYELRRRGHRGTFYRPASELRSRTMNQAVAA